MLPIIRYGTHIYCVVLIRHQYHIQLIQLGYLKDPGRGSPEEVPGKNTGISPLSGDFIRGHCTSPGTSSGVIEPLRGLFRGHYHYVSGVMFFSGEFIRGHTFFKLDRYGVERHQQLKPEQLSHHPYPLPILYILHYGIYVIN